jgi:acylphosphatase
MIIHGNVQGVWFRDSTMKEAKKLGIVGYAKNLNDGTVEVVSEGPENKLNKLIEFCKTGPDLAKVSKVDAKFEKADEEFDGFEIRY